MVALDVALVEQCCRSRELRGNRLESQKACLIVRIGRQSAQPYQDPRARQGQRNKRLSISPTSICFFVRSAVKISGVALVRKPRMPASWRYKPPIVRTLSLLASYRSACSDPYTGVI